MKKIILLLALFSLNSFSNETVINCYSKNVVDAGFTVEVKEINKRKSEFLITESSFVGSQVVFAGVLKNGFFKRNLFQSENTIIHFEKDFTGAEIIRLNGQKNLEFSELNCQ